MAHHTGLADPPTGRDVWRDTQVVRFADERLCVVTLVGTRRDPPRGPKPVHQRQRRIALRRAGRMRLVAALLEPNPTKAGRLEL